MKARLISALEWTALLAVTIAVTFGYLWTIDHFGVGRAGRWVMFTVMLVTPVVLMALMIREDNRAEDARWEDPPQDRPRPSK